MKLAIYWMVVHFTFPLPCSISSSIVTSELSKDEQMDWASFQVLPSFGLPGRWSRRHCQQTHTKHEHHTVKCKLLFPHHHQDSCLERSGFKVKKNKKKTQAWVLLCSTENEAHAIIGLIHYFGKLLYGMTPQPSPDYRQNILKKRINNVIQTVEDLYNQISLQVSKTNWKKHYLFIIL